MTDRTAVDPHLVAVIAAAVAAFEGGEPSSVRVVSVAPTLWAFAGRLEQSRRRGRR
jgi:phenylpyruvate tautomerase PptA (4-oxalocrotonate tautomerase family)